MVGARGLLAALLVVLGFGESLRLYGQGTQAGTALELTKSWDLPRAWSVSVGPATELRPLYAKDAEDAPPNALRNFDLNAGVERRWFERWSFGTGLRVRRRYALSDEPARELRSWWYATRTGAFRYVRTAQRFRTEQRWRSDVGEPLALSYRHRYQFGAERALSGVSVEPGEWAVLGSCEVLASAEQVARAFTSVDVRPYVGLARERFEVGVESRHERAVGAEATGDWAHVVLVVVQLGL